jgi:hypothetical protein
MQFICFAGNCKLGLDKTLGVCFCACLIFRTENSWENGDSVSTRAVFSNLHDLMGGGGQPKWYAKLKVCSKPKCVHKGRHHNITQERNDIKVYQPTPAARTTV